MRASSVMIAMLTVLVGGCENLEPLLPKPVTEDDCLLFVFRDPLKHRRKLELELADDTSVELYDYTYTKLNQPIGDQSFSIVKGLKDSDVPTSYTYSCMPKQTYYFALKRDKPLEDQEPEDAAVSIVRINDDQAFNRLQHFRFTPAMIVVTQEEQPDGNH